MKWIVVIGSTLAGAYGCIRYLNNQKPKAKQKQGNNTKNLHPVASSPQSVPIPRQAIPAVLCLVVPASVVSNLRKGNSLNAYNLETLIDNASYFLCTAVEDANSKQMLLEKTHEEIPIDSNREVYIKIYISNAQEMIDKKNLYILKRNLPSHGQGVVEQLACLKNLSGLEAFNRV